MWGVRAKIQSGAKVERMGEKGKGGLTGNIPLLEGSSNIFVVKDRLADGPLAGVGHIYWVSFSLMIHFSSMGAAALASSGRPQRSLL